MTINKKILNEAIKLWGEERQIHKMQEESIELSLALHKYMTTNADVHDVIDEIADNIIMMEQAKIIFGEHQVNERVKFKMNRLKKRIDDNNR
jgi:phosphoribosyl-ATP pyrophosphohydrolase